MCSGCTTQVMFHIKIQANEKQARRHRWMLSMFYKTVATVAKVLK